MDADEIEALGPALDGYLSEFDDCFGRVGPRGHLRAYVEGQLGGLPRTSVEPIALAAGLRPRTLQLFLSDATWGTGRCGTGCSRWWRGTTPTRWRWG